jgi:hypothetical protein
VMMTGRSIVTDENLRWLHVAGAPLPPPGSNRLPDYALRQLERHQGGGYAVTVVRRSVYEKVGGFSSLFTYCSDWDMWTRISLEGPVGAIARAYALVRTHAKQDNFLRGGHEDRIVDTFLIYNLNAERFRRAGLPVPQMTAQAFASASAIGHAWYQDSLGNLEGRLALARCAWRLAPSLRSFVFLVKSWLKRGLRGPRMVNDLKSAWA